MRLDVLAGLASSSGVTSSGFRVSEIVEVESGQARKGGRGRAPRCGGDASSASRRGFSETGFIWGLGFRVKITDIGVPERLLGLERCYICRRRAELTSLMEIGAHQNYCQKRQTVLATHRRQRRCVCLHCHGRHVFQPALYHRCCQYFHSYVF